MLKKYWYIWLLAVLIGLTAFFYPKDTHHGPGGAVALPGSIAKERACFGIKVTRPAFDTFDETCYGLVGQWREYVIK